jgi:peptidyl-tRNA hydrolase, PTH1 family
MVVDELARRYGGRFKRHRAHAQVCEAARPIPGVDRVVLAKPGSFMNTSGGPVAGLRDFYKVPVERMVVVHDDLDLPFGSVRLKRGGGSGGHNGLKSLAASLGDPGFIRARLGIGRPPGRMDPADYVLRPFGSTERKELELCINRTGDAVEEVLTRGLDAAQNVFNT